MNDGSNKTPDDDSPETLRPAPRFDQTTEMPAFKLPDEETLASAGSSPAPPKPIPGPSSAPPASGGSATERKLVPATPWPQHDVEATVNLTGDSLRDIPMRDDLAPPETASGEEAVAQASREHLKGLLEALVFVSDKPIRATDLARAASANTREVKELLVELRAEYAPRGVQLDEVAGGWIFRTNAAYAPFVRDLTKQKPVRLTRAQIETLAILAYRQPITRPEIDEIRGVDSGPVLKLLLERDLVKILGKKDEPGRPILYGTTTAFLEFFGLKSLKDLPTLREFTELNEDSRRVVERELGDVLDARQTVQDIAVDEMPPPTASPEAHDTLPPEAPEGFEGS